LSMGGRLHQRPWRDAGLPPPRPDVGPASAERSTVDNGPLPDGLGRTGGARGRAALQVAELGADGAPIAGLGTGLGWGWGQGPASAERSWPTFRLGLRRTSLLGWLTTFLVSATLIPRRFAMRKVDLIVERQRALACLAVRVAGSWTGAVVELGAKP